MRIFLESGRTVAEMSFKEDVFAKVITYITIAVLLGAMLVEAFVIYTERSEKKDMEARLASAQDTIGSLSQVNLNLQEENQELQEFKSNWENLVIVADDEICRMLREDLYARPELIPREAAEASLLAQQEDLTDDEVEELLEEVHFAFPSPEEKEWFLPLNLGNQPSAEYLFYARAVDEERDRYIDLLYEVPVRGEDEKPLTDEDGEIIWKCMAYDAGLGWQLVTEEEE